MADESREEDNGPSGSGSGSGSNGGNGDWARLKARVLMLLDRHDSWIDREGRIIVERLVALRKDIDVCIRDIHVVSTKADAAHKKVNRSESRLAVLAERLDAIGRQEERRERKSEDPEGSGTLLSKQNKIILLISGALATLIGLVAKLVDWIIGQK